MSTLNKTGLWFLGIGFIILVFLGLREVVPEFVDTDEITLFVKVAIVLLVGGFFAIFAALVIERVKDNKNEHDTFNNRHNPRP